jgi:hypothetical protein
MKIESERLSKCGVKAAWRNEKHGGGSNGQPASNGVA